jgi:CRP-like cAMP-binding protein
MYDRLRKMLSGYTPFSDKEFDELTSRIKLLSLKKNEFLFQGGEIDRYLAFVNKGCLRYFMLDSAGEEQTIYFAFENWWIGDMQSFFSETKSLYTMQALEDCELFAFSRENFQYALDNITPFSIFFKTAVPKSYASMQERFARRQLESAEERYLALLKKQPDMFQRVPQYLIASYLGIKPQSLSRIRKKLSAESD